MLLFFSTHHKHPLFPYSKKYAYRHNFKEILIVSVFDWLFPFLWGWRGGRRGGHFYCKLCDALAVHDTFELPLVTVLLKTLSCVRPNCECP